MKRKWLFGAIGVGFAFAVAELIIGGISSKVQALEVLQPTSEFYVNDQADVLSEDAEKTFISRSKALDEATGQQVVILTIPTLGEESLEEYSLETARKWGIGQKDKNNGILILLVTDDHLIRIEVGYGVEEKIPDGLAGRLQRTFLTPRLKEGDFDGGVLSLQTAIIQALNDQEITGDPDGGPTLAELEETFTENESEESDDGFLTLALWLLAFGGVIYYSFAKKNNFWKKCPKCGHRKWTVEQKYLSEIKVTEDTVTCKKCGYQKKTKTKDSSGGGSGLAGFLLGSSFGSSSSGGSGGFSGGSSGGGGSFGGGGSSGRW